MTPLPTRINQLRSSGLPQRRIAEELGISQSQVRRYLAGYEGPGKKARQGEGIARDVRRWLAEAKTEDEKRCILNNFGNFLEA